MLDPASKIRFAEDGLIRPIFEAASQRLIEIVFRKQIGLDRIPLKSEGQVLNRYRLIVKRQFTKGEIELIAARLYKDDYGHPFKEDEGVYWTFE